MSPQALTLLFIIVFAALFAAIGYVRGRGMIPRWGHVIASIAWALVTAGAAAFLGYREAYVIAIGIVAFIGLLIWLVGLKKGWGGWGLYFASWTWVWNPNEREVPPIDWIGLKLVPFKTMAPHWTNGLRGTICMSLRGLYITPLFLMLSALESGLIVGLSQGLVYGSMRWLAPTAGTKYAEPVFAAIIGVAVANKLLAGF